MYFQAASIALSVPSMATSRRVDDRRNFDRHP